MRAGYLQRCLVKNLESLKVHYDCTVRDDCDKSIVQVCVLCAVYDCACGQRCLRAVSPPTAHPAAARLPSLPTPTHPHPPITSSTMARTA